jgi:uncharacterized protein (TIGR02646 family)
MRQIVKEREPRTLTEHRASPHADYENYADKAGLREALVREQGGLCCYCMQRIAPDGRQMKIEHWAAQETHPELQLDYKNLLGACAGGQGLPPAQQHCDTRKGSQALTIHPANPQRPCERLIVYAEDGTIEGTLPEVHRDLTEVLNLNLPWLREGRKNVVRAVVEGMSRRYSLEWKKITLEREIQRWRERDRAGDFREYCQIAVFWLEKRLARAMR